LSAPLRRRARYADLAPGPRLNTDWPWTRWG
jgi:hypothetical protein